ncbi:ATP adenylyltransferase [Nitratiruptor sp. YY08-26]|uniref:HIT family protein n=1 Tax=unclassified Nitratiruptor TaxID=2624044 RepID=UPI001916AC43|nr:MULTISPECIES: HIT domain-containing protein [unclassified Nitratiruptor]BCD62465.1 ATP adenylyltransferase [Nitratiruptor sp. YY08-13]BCD66401.1 ATP adenylyltransferase [Nitratiruptor sp. YY08-26]
MRKILYAPWRSEYVTGKKIEGCVFCYIVEHPEEDEELGVLYRAENSFAVMNKYPYSPGHFMIIPNRHIDNLEDLEEDVWLEIAKLAKRGVKLLKDVLGAEGVNMGMNLGAAAGAGIAEHIHLHLVPRWQRDTNFITTIAETRVYSTDFFKIYQKLRKHAKEYFEG